MRGEIVLPHEYSFLHKERALNKIRNKTWRVLKPARSDENLWKLFNFYS